MTEGEYKIIKSRSIDQIDIVINSFLWFKFRKRPFYVQRSGDKGLMASIYIINRDQHNRYNGYNATIDKESIKVGFRNNRDFIWTIYE